MSRESASAVKSAGDIEDYKVRSREEAHKFSDLENIRTILKTSSSSPLL